MVVQEQSSGVVVLEGQGQMLKEKTVISVSNDNEEAYVEKGSLNVPNICIFILNVRDKCTETVILPVGTTMGGGLGTIM